MIPDVERTIVALGSSAQGTPRGIVRISGARTRELLSGLVTPETAGKWIDSPRPISGRAELVLAPELPTLPARVLFWPTRRSYTGEPAAEIHTLGSQPLLQCVIQRALTLGAEPAERGEFTLRAFLAGKLDLSQAEAVLGVIEAGTRDSLQVALAQLGGNLAPLVRPLRDQIVELLAHLEAGLDFVEEDIEFISAAELTRGLSGIRQGLAAFATRLDTRSSTSRAPRVVLFGAPNSGKSSLFNALGEGERAIVSERAGTTRDYLVQPLHFDGHSCDLVDTAGLEETTGSSPRALAQTQLAECLASADVLLWCIPSLHLPEVNFPTQPTHTQPTRSPLASELVDGWRRLQTLRATRRVPLVLVGTKRDQDSRSEGELTAAAWGLAATLASLPAAGSTGSPADHWLSAASGGDVGDIQGVAAVALTSVMSEAGINAGLQGLRAALGRTLVSQAAGEGVVLVHHTAVRCRGAVAAALAGIDQALELTELGGGEELVAGELRLVLDELATIIGEVHSDDILGEIFGRFCIGK
jgi:tRNA modification GTPase